MGDFGDNNWLTGILIHGLDPTHIYENMTYFSGTLALAPWLIVVFVAIRILQESGDVISGKAALAKALGDGKKMVVMFLAYVSGGFVVFGFMFALGELAKGFGSEQLVHSLMLELRAVLTADSDAHKDWLLNVLEVVADVTNLPMAGLVWVLYQFVSVAYIALSRLIDVLFAIGVVLTYAWGFIAIPTMMLKDSYNLTPGFVKTVLALGIWLVLEPILLLTVWLLMLGGAEFLASYYGGTAIGTVSVMMWYIFAIVAMSLVLIMKIIAPFLALYLSRNEAMVGALGAAPAALGAIVANQVVTMMKENSMSQATRDMAPTAGGDRTRDQLAGAMNAPLGQLFGGKDPNNLAAQSGPSGGPGGGGPDGSGGGGSGGSYDWSGTPDPFEAGESQAPGDGGAPNPGAGEDVNSQSSPAGADISSVSQDSASAGEPGSPDESTRGESVRNDLSDADTDSGAGDSGRPRDGGGGA